MASPVSAPLAFAHPSHCVREIPRGAVKRIFASAGAPLLGYYIRCPACGFPGSYLDTEAGFVEGPWVADQGEPKPGAAPLPFQRVATLEMQRPVVCFGCRGQLRIVAGVVTVTGAQR